MRPDSKSSPTPRVFISSVIDGFEDYREAAADGVRDAGMEPLRVETDFPSRTDSSRNACLDAVASCDVLLLVIGERGGGAAPSGKLVVEEEWEEARIHKLPRILLLQDVSRDEKAEGLARRLSDYTEGRFRQTFSTPEDLRQKVAAALREQRRSMTPHETDVTQAFASFAEPVRNAADEPIVRLRLVPRRSGELIEPQRMTSGDLHEELTRMAMQQDVALFGLRQGHDMTFRSGEIRLTQDDLRQHSSAGVRVVISGAGHCSIDALVTDSGGNGARSGMPGMVMAVEELERILRSGMRFCHAMFESLDPYARFQHFHFNAALFNLGHRSLERNPQPRNSHTMRMGGGDPLVAYSTSRSIERGDLSDPSAEITRVVALLEQAATESRW